MPTKLINLKSKKKGFEKIELLLIQINIKIILLVIINNKIKRILLTFILKLYIKV